MRRGGTVESGKQNGGRLGEEPSNKVVFGRTSDGMSTLMNVLAISATTSPGKSTSLTNVRAAFVRCLSE
jgi:phosphomannomutase